jgi:hypothetical protein
VTRTAELALLQQLLLQGGSFAQQAPESSAPTAAAANPAAAGGDASIASIACPLSTEQLQQIISENAYSEPSEDAGASLLRELSPESVTGLWPEFALLNHSCAPNTVAVVVGQYLLLRATAPVLAGEELNCSYLGQRGLAPVALRRAYLQGVYGFHCQVSCLLGWCDSQPGFASNSQGMVFELVSVTDRDAPAGSVRLPLPGELLTQLLRLLVALPQQLKYSDWFGVSSTDGSASAGSAWLPLPGSCT